MPEETLTKPPKRCMKEGCKCKLTLTDFACRCDKYFCSQHRISECHNCTFDYKGFSREILLKTLSTPIIAEKVSVI